MTQGNDMGTVLLEMTWGRSFVSHFSETHGDRYKRTVPLNLQKDRPLKS